MIIQIITTLQDTIHLQTLKSWKMKFGLMPPHPASLIKRDIYIKHGLYNKNFQIAADFELFLRLFVLKKVKFKIINYTIVRMRSGGIFWKKS